MLKPWGLSPAAERARSPPGPPDLLEWLELTKEEPLAPLLPIVDVRASARSHHDTAVQLIIMTVHCHWCQRTLAFPFRRRRLSSQVS